MAAQQIDGNVTHVGCVGRPCDRVGFTGGDLLVLPGPRDDGKTNGGRAAATSTALRPGAPVATAAAVVGPGHWPGVMAQM